MNTPQEQDNHGHNEKFCPVCNDEICTARKSFERIVSDTTENSPKWSDQRVVQKLMSFARNIHALKMKQDRESKRPTK